MLLRRVFRVPPGAWVVFHSAAGGVGTLAGQWLRSIGAHAIGTVGSESKLAAARAAGYEEVLVRGRDDWSARARELSGGGVAAVYDRSGATPGRARSPASRRAATSSASAIHPVSPRPSR